MAIPSICLGLTTPAILIKGGGHDQYGENLPGITLNIKCAVLKMADILQPSPIRSEASASHGRVDEDIGVGIILVPANTNVKETDIISVFGITYAVTGLSPQADNFGNINHIMLNVKRAVTS